MCDVSRHMTRPLVGIMLRSDFAHSVGDMIQLFASNKLLAAMTIVAIATLGVVIV